MKYTPRPFDNSDEAIDKRIYEIFEAKEFVYGFLQHVGLLTEDHVLSSLDFDDVFSVMVDYKLQNTPQEQKTTI